MSSLETTSCQRYCLSLESVQRRATKYILNDNASDYISRVISLRLLPLIHYFELCDLMFFIKNIKYPSDNFNIIDYITFSKCGTRSFSHYKLRHNKALTSSYRHFTSIILLANSLPLIDLGSPLSSIKSNITKLIWSHFKSHFDLVYPPFILQALNAFELAFSKCCHAFSTNLTILFYSLHILLCAFVVL